MYHSIFVPLDGSPFGEQALPLALAIARRARVPVQVAHVHAPLPEAYAESLTAYQTLYQISRTRARDYLDALSARLHAATPIPVTAALLEGDVVDALHEHVAARGADLIVLTTHGRGPFSRFWLGSVADQLLRRASVPLLFVHPAHGLADLNREAGLARVLVALDGSPAVEQIVEPAVALAGLMGSRVTLLRVVEPLPPFGVDPVTYSAETDDPGLELQLQEARGYLDGVARGLRAKHLDVDTIVLVHPHPATAIVEEAEKEHGTLIALQTHGRRGLARLVLGSVADKVIRSTTLPVLINRPRAQAKELP